MLFAVVKIAQLNKKKSISVVLTQSYRHSKFSAWLLSAGLVYKYHILLRGGGGRVAPCSLPFPVTDGPWRVPILFPRVVKLNEPLHGSGAAPGVSI